MGYGYSDIIVLMHSFDVSDDCQLIIELKHDNGKEINMIDFVVLHTTLNLDLD